MYVEATRMHGDGKLTLTGQLGDVMKESATLAMNWLRSNARRVSDVCVVSSKSVSKQVKHSFVAYFKPAKNVMKSLSVFMHTSLHIIIIIINIFDVA